jgi:transposase InsO family protein
VVRSRAGDRSDPIRVFQFMSANRAFFAIATMARVLGVSTAGYYAWRFRLPSARAIADDALLRRVRTIHPARRHSGIGYLSPIAYETQMLNEPETT